ncbi:MAG: hypothetical protein Q8R13_04670 [bacterium]|nr:hypothetical protein [bacterium]
MPTVIINGRRVDLPDSTTEREIRKVGGIDPQRMLIRRTRLGNYLIPKGSEVSVDEEDAFIDAPARIKGSYSCRG